MGGNKIQLTPQVDLKAEGQMNKFKTGHDYFGDCITRRTDHRVNAKMLSSHRMFSVAWNPFMSSSEIRPACVHF
jgi:hypothetical protein